MTNPCKDCDRRHHKCWSDCEQYIAWKSESQAAKRALYEGREATNFLMDSMAKTQKRKKK